MVFPILLSIVLLEIVVSLILGFYDPLGLLGSIFIVCLALYVTIRFVSPTVAKKNNKKILNTNVEYRFTDASFEIKVETPQIKSEENITYDFLYKVFETDEYFYLFSNTAAVYIAAKSDMGEEAALQLREVIRGQMPAKKYILCK